MNLDLSATHYPQKWAYSAAVRPMPLRQVSNLSASAALHSNVAILLNTLRALNKCRSCLHLQSVCLTIFSSLVCVYIAPALPPNVLSSLSSSPKNQRCCPFATCSPSLPQSELLSLLQPSPLPVPLQFHLL